MPDYPTRGPSRRGVAAAILVPAAAVAAIFTASSMANGNTTNNASAVQAPTDTGPSLFSPNTGGGGGTTSAPGGGATGTRTATPTRTGTATSTGVPVVPGAPTAPSGTAAATCVTVAGTPTPTRTGGGVVPSPSGTRTGTHGPTGTTGPTRTGGSVVPGAVEATTPSGTATHSAPPGEVRTTLKVGTAGGKSNVIVDDNGCALYLNTRDTPENTAVSPAMESSFIPALAPAEVTGLGLDPNKVGTFTRPDGVRQATYNGHQLYRFAGDRAPGEAKGQGVDDQFFLIGSNGEPTR
jgi:predicted lipoprotein with Yx(FWY)xxD motif